MFERSHFASLVYYPSLAFHTMKIRSLKRKMTSLELGSGVYLNCSAVFKIVGAYFSATVSHREVSNHIRLSNDKPCFDIVLSSKIRKGATKVASFASSKNISRVRWNTRNAPFKLTLHFVGGRLIPGDAMVRWWHTNDTELSGAKQR